MKEQEILDGNKLIAEFMGLIKVDCYGNDKCFYYYFQTSDNFRLTKEIIEAENFNILDYAWSIYNLSYHSSWDWLMPVIKKIDSECRAYESIKKLSITSDISKVYEEVITYINWKNDRLIKYAEPDNKINTFIVKTSDLGHNCGVYKVKTNITISGLHEIDLLYGMMARWESTSIKDLENGAKQLGLMFEYETLLEPTEKYDSKCETFKEDYFANYGNY